MACCSLLLKIFYTSAIISQFVVSANISYWQCHISNIGTAGAFERVGYHATIDLHEMLSNRHTDTQTHRPSTVTLAAHVYEGKIYYFRLVH